MTSVALATAPAPGADATLAQIAPRLIDIAQLVAAEAESATATIRAFADQAGQIATLAATLEDAANRMEDGVAVQAAALVEMRSSLAHNEPAVAGLARSADSMAAICTAIGRISRQSRLLALNARIEASRGGVEGAGFAAVAREMSGLAEQTKTATDDVTARAGAIATSADAARAVVESHTALVETQHALLSTTRDHAARQRRAAADLVAISGESASAIDEAALRMGRLGAAAVTVKTLARQIARLTRPA